MPRNFFTEALDDVRARFEEAAYGRELSGKTFYHDHNGPAQAGPNTSEQEPGIHGSHRDVLTRREDLADRIERALERDDARTDSGTEKREADRPQERDREIER